MTSCPFIATELHDLSRRTLLECLMGKVRTVVKLDDFIAKHKDIEFDDDRGIACQTTKG